jgi:cyclopropane-fatty-acyl-phospholipid synthase
MTESLSFANRCFREFVCRRLGSLSGGGLSIIDGDETRSFGDRTSELQATIKVNNSRFYRRVALGGGLAAAESLMDGDWQADDLTAVVQIFARNLEATERLGRGLARTKQILARFGHWCRQNTINGAKRNICAHYDLSNEFFALFLDPSMTYSCGIFESSGTTMWEASIAKIDRVCRRLDLQPSDHLIEIGSGWGALAIYAAKHFGCRVTTTTISNQQYDYVREAICRNGLDDQITLLKQDYRTLTGQYNKLVSIEMIEAVGSQFYGTFFGKCRELLRSDGIALLQSIVIADERYDLHRRNVDFVNRYIFPGGQLPSVSELAKAAAMGGQLRVMQLDEFGLHYAETLRRWREQFQMQLETVRSLGFDERFIRMWNYYLCYCEAGFEERRINLVQMLLAGRSSRFDVPGRDMGSPYRQSASRKPRNETRPALNHVYTAGPNGCAGHAINHNNAGWQANQKYAEEAKS